MEKIRGKLSNVKSDPRRINIGCSLSFKVYFSDYLSIQINSGIVISIVRPVGALVTKENVCEHQCNNPFDHYAKFSISLYMNTYFT